MIGISYPTIKQWIYDGKIESIKTPGGHHRIPPSEVERLTGHKLNLPSNNGAMGRSSETISVRNKLVGRVTEISFGGLFAEITVDVGGQQIVSIITKSACDDLELKVGMDIYTLYKATEVMISRG